MRANEVPQDASFLEGHRRGAYAVGEDGRYTLVATKGWEVETAATSVALKVADAQITRAWELAKAGVKSPLHYHLAAKQLTCALLAAYAGTYRWVVWWHTRPGPFARLSDERLEQYAKGLGRPVEVLKTLPERPESWQ